MVSGHTASDEDLVRESWAAVVVAFSFQKVGMMIYEKMFEKDPDLPDTLFRGVDFSKQSVRLVEMVDAAVKLLDKPTSLVPELITLGERHAGYGTEGRHFDGANESVLEVLEAGLADKFTPAVKKAWTNALGVITGVMKQGLHNERGRAAFARYKARLAAASLSADQLPPSATETDEDVVRRTWRLAKQKYNYEQLGTVFYGTMFQLDQSLLLTLFKHVRGPRQSIRLMEALDFAVSALDRPIALVPKLVELGERHAGYGLTEKHMDLGGEALILTLMKVLGREFTPEVKKAWISTYSIISVTMCQGMNSAKGKELFQQYHQSNPAEGRKAEEWVRHTWGLAISTHTFVQLGSLIYETIFEFDTTLRSTLFKGVDMGRQSLKLIEMVDTAIKMLDKPTELVPTLVTLGERHGGYGVEERHLTVAGEALIKILRESLGSDQFPAEAQSAWVNVYKVIQGAMVQGLHSERGRALFAEYKARQVQS